MLLSHASITALCLCPSASHSVSPSLWSRNKSTIGQTAWKLHEDIHFFQRILFVNSVNPLTFPPAFCGYEGIIPTIIGWISIRFGADIPAPSRIKCNCIDDPIID